MNYTLTEEQSREVLWHFENYLPLILKINEKANEFMHQYYLDYLSNGKYWLWHMSERKFFKKIGTDGEYFVVSDDYHGLPIVFATSCNVGLNDKFLKKHNIIIEPVNAEVIFESIECPNPVHSNLVIEVTQISNLLNTYYKTIPFDMGTDELLLYGKIAVANSRRIELLKNVGIEYDL